MKTSPVKINSVEYPVNVFLEKRNNSTVLIGKKSINIHISLSISREEVFREILRMKSWAKQKIISKPEKFTPKEQKTYSDGQVLKIGTEEYTLRIIYKEKESSSAKIRGNNIFLTISSKLNSDLKRKHISTLVSRCVARKRLADLQKRISAFNELHFKQKINRIFFKYNKSNWGSCSKQGNINISTRLLFAPDDVLDYVCIHELAHLIEQNHSDRFWALVEKAMPDYKEKRKWLKEKGIECDF